MMATLMSLLSQQVVERLGWTLIHFVWQATAVALFLAILLRLLRRASSSLRYTISCLSLALTVALPLVTMPFVAVSRPAAEAGPPPIPSTRADALPARVVEVETLSIEPLGELPPETMGLPARMAWKERFVDKLESALPYLVLGWLVGVFGLSTWHLGGWAQLQRMKRRMVRRVADPMQSSLAQLATQLGIRKAVTLLESALVEVPTVVGWVRPVILLPASALTGLSAEQLEAILAHELAHVKRYDYLVNVAQTIVEILGFYHPAVWWVSQRIRDERENCCDDLAVRICGDSVRYAKALTHMEEMRHRGVELAVAATGGSLVGRIGRLIGRPATTENRFAWLPGLIALLLVAGVVVPAAWALAGPAPESSGSLTPDESPSLDPDASEDASESALADGEIPHTQVLLKFTVVDMPANLVLDPETAATVQGLLARGPTGQAELGATSTTAPTIAELQEPLGVLFAKFVPVDNESKQLADLLVARGYATAVSNPRIRTSEHKPASIAVGNVDDPNVPTGSGIKLTVTAHVLHSQDATRLTIDYLGRHRLGDPNDPNAPLSVSQVASTIVVPNDQYAALVAGQVGDSSGPVRLLLVSPQVPSPRPPDMGGYIDDPLPTRLYRSGRSRTSAIDADESNETQVHMAFIIANVLAGATLLIFD